jgi:phosphatidylcholine synthase
MPNPAGHRRILVVLGMLVHLYTASGLVTALLAINWIIEDQFRLAFLAMFVAVIVDATDGTLARAVDVWRVTPWVNGRKLDDIVDYLNYTFVPILMVWRADWLPEPTWLWLGIPLIASAFAFVHEGAKEDDRGFFRGFPSYWNVVVFYAATLITPNTQWLMLPILLGLSVLSVAPIRFVYPNRPPCWIWFFLGGAAIWGVILLVMLVLYPNIPRWLTAISLVYPVAYTLSSFFLDWADRTHRIRR